MESKVLVRMTTDKKRRINADSLSQITQHNLSMNLLPSRKKAPFESIRTVKTEGESLTKSLLVRSLPLHSVLSFVRSFVVPSLPPFLLSLPSSAGEFPTGNRKEGSTGQHYPVQPLLPSNPFPVGHSLAEPGTFSVFLS